jgi:hypothetical protein
VSETDDRALAKAWIDLQRAERGMKDDDPRFAAHVALDELRTADPERCWSVILMIFELDQSDRLLANLAAGPLEDLLVTHGERVIGRVETLARQEPRFRFTIQMVWRNAISAPVWARLRKAATLAP